MTLALLISGFVVIAAFVFLLAVGLCKSAAAGDTLLLLDDDDRL